MSQEANKPAKEQRVKILWISAAPDFKYEARIGVYTQHTGNYLLKTFREFAAAREQYLKLGQGEVSTKKGDSFLILRFVEKML